MSDPLSALNSYRKKLGVESLALIGLSFTVLAFGAQLDESVKSEYLKYVSVLAGALFSLGVVIGIIRLASKLFSDRPAKGILDGLAAGLVAGILGGALGFGYHASPEYIESSYIRIGLCVMFSIPIGGVVGFFVDFSHPDRIIDFKKIISGMILAMAIIFSFVGLGLHVFVPTMKGAGIILGDIQLLFETLLVVLAGIIAIDRNWTIRAFILRLPNLIIGILIARMFTHLSVSHSIYNENIPLYKRRFLDIVEHQIDLPITIIAFMVWTILIYTMYSSNHYGNTWLLSRYNKATLTRPSSGRSR